MEKPTHIAIIMDGNGRWAKKRHLTRNYGHRKGAETLKKLIQEMERVGGYTYLTVFAFSTENWKRGNKEVEGLMNLLREYIQTFIKDAETENIQLKTIGNKTRLPRDLLKDMEKMEQITVDKTGLQVNIAIDYGGRDDILRMTKSILEAYKQGEIDIKNVTEDTLGKYVDTKDIPDPDLLIRTSGEHRISNFLLWQLAYTEIYVTDTLWPDFSHEALLQAIAVFEKRQRRFGR